MMKLRHRLRRVSSRSWAGWPAEAYAQMQYQQRLLAVQEHLRGILKDSPAGPLRLISVCAGDGRDVIGTVRAHERRGDVSAWLVELDRQSVAAGIQEASIAGLECAVNFINADATEYGTYLGVAPADIVLACGVWGHVPAHERESLARALAALCKPRGTVTWTRGVSSGLARLNEIAVLFARSDWENVRTTITADKKWAVATYCYAGPLVELPEMGRIFNFQRHAGR
ncbi:MAG TPA: class I SAM-dependent methyltransferase [Lacipirellulaceae bacterium]|nr:class I SAM-dependent methyltransferase [Lacipirellulaceae bacterium]